jgi:hypothetical protein
MEQCHYSQSLAFLTSAIGRRLHRLALLLLLLRRRRRLLWRRAAVLLLLLWRMAAHRRLLHHGLRVLRARRAAVRLLGGIVLGLMGACAIGTLVRLARERLAAAHGRHWKSVNISYS